MCKTSACTELITNDNTKVKNHISFQIQLLFPDRIQSEFYQWLEARDEDIILFWTPSLHIQHHTCQKWPTLDFVMQALLCYAHKISS